MSETPQTFEAVLARQMQDAEFRAHWERTAVARALALRILAYRTERHLSQSQLARQLGMKQPAIARLELGEHNPSLETLYRISQSLGIEFLIAVSPDGRPPTWVTREAEHAAVVEQFTTAAGTRVLVAAG